MYQIKPAVAGYSNVCPVLRDYTNINDAVDRARELARDYQVDYAVYKEVQTHYIKHPVMPEAEVTEVDAP